MTKDEMQSVMQKVFAECQALREAGQKEYAHREENAFANFERVAERNHISREQVLLVYMEKHLDGIHSYVNGHRSQRESVTGRINDMIVYLCLLRGMVDNTSGKLSRITLEDKKYAKDDCKVSVVCASGGHGNCVWEKCGCACHV